EVLPHPIRLESPQLVFGKTDPTADADVETALEEMVERADLLGQADRMMERQQVHERSEPYASRVLSGRREEQSDLRDRIEPDHVVLRFVVSLEAGLVGGSDERQPLSIQLVQRPFGDFDLVEDPVSHHFALTRSNSVAADTTP